jgi:hypothetical protein
MQGLQLIHNEIDHHTNMIDYMSSKCRCSTRPVLGGWGSRAAAPMAGIAYSNTVKRMASARSPRKALGPCGPRDVASRRA